MASLKLNAISVILLSLAAQLVGLFRISLVASIFGTSPAFDAFSLVTNISTFVFGVIAGGVTVALIPALMQTTDRQIIDTVQTILYLVIFVGAIGLWSLEIPLLNATSVGRTQFIITATSVATTIIIGQALLALTGLTTAYLQSQGHFALPKVATLASVALLLALIALDDRMTIGSYALYIAMTNGLNVILQLITSVALGYRYRPRFSWRHHASQNYIKMFFPIAVSTGVYQLTLIVDTIICGTLGEGRISILAYITSIVGIINSVISMNLSSIVYPKLATAVAHSVVDAYALLGKYLLLLSTVVTGVAVIFLATGKNVVDLFLLRGSFTATDSKAVFYGCCILVIVMPFDVVRDMTYRYYYARSLTRVPLTNSLVASVVNLVASLCLAKAFDIYGVILGTALSIVASTAMVRYRLRREVQTHGAPKDRGLKPMLKLVIAFAGAMVVSALTRVFLPTNPILQIIISGAIALATYTAFIFVYAFRNVSRSQFHS